MTTARLRRWAYLEAMIVCGVTALGLAARLVYAPDRTVATALAADVVALLALAGLSRK
jgi:hypothetical protein